MGRDGRGRVNLQSQNWILGAAPGRETEERKNIRVVPLKGSPNPSLGQEKLSKPFAAPCPRATGLSRGWDSIFLPDPPAKF